MKNSPLFFGFLIMIGLSGCQFFSSKSAEELQKDAETRARYADVAVRSDAEKTIFAFMGKPGSGKGTLAEQAARMLEFKVLSTGDLCRSEIASGSERGTIIENMIKDGQLVPDETIISMVDEWLEREQKGEADIILDGFPRTQRQAEMIFDLLKQKYQSCAFRVVILDVSDQDVLKRLADRLVCENKGCQSIFSRTRLDLICPVCGSALAPRVDDKEVIVRDRLNIYTKHAGELISFYKVAGFTVNSISVSGLSTNNVYNEFKKILTE